jgi:DNA-binding SARP family transcriptional activator
VAGTGERFASGDLSRRIDDSTLPILICLLGSFRLLCRGQPLPQRGGGKTEALLCYLAIRQGQPVPRDTLMDRLWPDSDAALATQSLNSLVYSLHKALGAAIAGAAPVSYAEGCYRINADAGVGVDVWVFDTLARAGEAEVRSGERALAVPYYRRAVQLYRGDLCVSSDVRAVVERERLRVLYLSLLARLADFYFAQGDYSTSLEQALRLLLSEPTREDAHRLVMRCYVRRGERAQALRQFRICEQILHREFDAAPEHETVALFDQVRRDPTRV